MKKLLLVMWACGAAVSGTPIKPAPGAGVNLSHPLAQGLEHVILFNEGGGTNTNVRDLITTKTTISNSSFTSNSLNPGAWVPTEWGVGFTQGTNNFGAGVTVKDVRKVLFPSTLFVIFRYDGTGSGGGTPISHSVFQTNNGYRVTITSGGLISFTLGGIADYPTSITLTSGKWYALAATPLSNGGSCLVYVYDYAAKAMTRQSLAIGTVSSSGTTWGFDVGYTSPFGGAYITGVYVMGAHWSRALSSGEIMRLALDPFAFVRMPNVLSRHVSQVASAPSVPTVMNPVYGQLRLPVQIKGE